MKKWTRSLYSLMLNKLGNPDTIMRASLENTHLFGKLTPEQFDQLLKSVKLVRFNTGDIIIRQDDIADHFYLIKSGAIRIYLTRNIINQKLYLPDSNRENTLVNKHY